MGPRDDESDNSPDDEGEPVWPLYTDSWWYRLLGPLAPMARFVVAYMLLIVIFTVATRLPGMVRGLLDDEPAAVPVVMPIDTTSNSIDEISRQITSAYQRLEHAITAAETTLARRKELLVKLQADAESLQLTSAQKAIVGRIPQQRPTLTFQEWVRDENVYYGLALNFVTSALFFVLGLKYPGRRRRSVVSG
jgi:hypothetical protein